MTEDEIIHHFPILYHVTEEHAWPSIRRHGLECTSAILDRFGIEGPERASIESNRRETHINIHHSSHAQVRLSDHQPIIMTVLSRCLSGMTAAEWFEMLNARVFFWPTRDRLNRHLNARLNRERDKCVITFDTAALVERHRADMQVSAINSGCTRPPQPRGLGTFLPLADYPFEDVRRRRGPKKSIAEVTVLRRVDDLENLAIRAEIYRTTEPGALIWQR